MSMKKIIICAILANFIVIGQAPTGPSDEFTRDEYLGIWYTVRFMAAVGSCYPLIVCPHIEVRQRGYNNWKLQQFDYQKSTDGTKEIVRSVRGEIIRSKIHLKLNPDGKDAVMNVTKYNNGTELILLGTENKLISRVRSASVRARRAFKRLANQANLLVYHVDDDNCQ